MLWFKNIIIYRLKGEILLDPKEIEQKLALFSFTPCKSQAMVKWGWVSPMGPKSCTLMHELKGQILISARKEEKILPSFVVRQELQKKIDRQEIEQSRKLHKTEKETLKDEVIHTLIPRAFSCYTQIMLWLNTVNNLIIVNVGSIKKAEECLALLRKSIGSLPIVPLMLEQPIAITLTRWVRDSAPPSAFVIQDEAELKGLLETDGIVRCKKQDLASHEIATHIEAGKIVTKLALNWKERIQFVLGEDGTMKRLKFSDTLREKNPDIYRESFETDFAADFMLMSSELGELITDLTKAMGAKV